MKLGVILGGLVVAAVAWPLRAGRCETTSSALAEALFQEATRLMDAGNVNEACSKLEDSFRLEPLPGTLLRMALCHELQNKTATAYLEFSRGRAWAERDGRRDRVAFAQEHIDKLRPQLAYVSVQVPKDVGALPGLQVHLNDVPLSRAAWGVPTAVDPGPQVVKVAADGHEPATAEAKAEPAKTVEIKAPTPRANPLARQQQPERRLGATFWVAGGVGVAAVGVATFYGLRAMDEASGARDLCGEGPLCADPRGLAANDEAKSAALVANVAAAVGVVGLGTAAALWWWQARQPTGAREGTPVNVAVAPLLDGGLVTIGGRL